MKRSALLPLTLALGCAAGQNGDTPTPPTATGAEDIARAGVEDDALGALLSEHWAYLMKTNPVWATRLGDHRYDDRLGDGSEAAIDADRKATRAFLARAKAVPTEGLSQADATTLELFTSMLEKNAALDVCQFETWALSPRSNPVTNYNELAKAHAIKSNEDANNLLKRYGQAATQIDHTTANLARGAKAGVYANAESVRRVQAMVKDQLAKPVKDWPPMKIETDYAWGDGEEEKFTTALQKLLENEIRPAFERYGKLLETEIAPNARSPEQTGLGALPFGKDCYQARIAYYTGLPLSAKDIHETGKSEILRINGEMKKLGKKLFGTDALPEILEKLRTDPANFFETSEQIVDKAETALANARAAIPKYFGVLPKADCVVAKIPDYEAPFTTVAYYQQPVPDGSKPGEYYVNLYKPETRTRYEMEALSFHEAIPGHHLQIAIAQELPAMPAFRRHLGLTAFVEGWALYTEQLADEMGLYSGDLDRMGMLSYEAWRASRLVVDTGIHAMGWSRERAKQYMLEHTALAANNIDNEVDRYIVWPGQAVAYKTGQMEIWRLRREAETALGDKFDIKGFHDAVLTGGAVSLPVLKKRVHRWADSLK